MCEGRCFFVACINNEWYIIHRCKTKGVCFGEIRKLGVTVEFDIYTKCVIVNLKKIIMNNKEAKNEKI